MKKNIIIFTIIAIVLILVRYFYTLFYVQLNNKNKLIQIVPEVKVSKVKTVKQKKCYEAPGRVTSIYQVAIVARVSGYLQKSYFKEGTIVKSGDILFQIEPDEYRENAEIAYADINKISAQLDYANKQLERAKELVKQDYIAKARYDEILSNRNSLIAQLEAAKNNYNDKKRYLGYTNVKAPIDGRIGTIDVTIGNYVTPNTGVLTTINSIDPIYVTFPMSAQNYDEISRIDKDNNLNRKVELYYINGVKYDYDGIQDFYDNEVDKTTGSVTFRAIFKNPESRLLNGEFVKVKIFTNNDVPMAIVPVTAVQSNQEGKYLYRINDDNIAQMVYITDSGQVGDNLIVSDGVKEGDTIIVDGLAKVSPNKKVKIIN